MEKAITYPAFSNLYLRGLLRLIQMAGQSRLELCQSYTFAAHRMVAQIWRA